MIGAGGATGLCDWPIPADPYEHFKVRKPNSEKFMFTNFF